MISHNTIVVVGGGPVGLLFSLIYSKNKNKVIILDPFAIDQNDGRVIALSYSSIEILKNLNIWDESLVTFIDKIHISHSGLGVSNILKHDFDIDYLGCTIKYYDLYLLLLNKVNINCDIKIINAEAKHIESFDDYSLIHYNSEDKHHIIKSDITVVADGGKLKIDNIFYKEFDYMHEAIVTELFTKSFNDNIAYERFDNHGAFVLLPYSNKYILIWSKKNIDAAKLNLNLLINDNFFKRFGEFKLSNEVYKFPLKYRLAKNKSVNKIVLIGNAAQTLNPISAQGINLAFRDANDLCKVLENADIPAYCKLRDPDTKFITNFTHLLARFLYSDLFMKKKIITFGLISISNFKYIQKKIFNFLIFGIIDHNYDKKL